MDKRPEDDLPEPDAIDEPSEDRGEGIEEGLEPNEDGTLPVGG
jgi:hypothetical protein